MENLNPNHQPKGHNSDRTLEHLASRYDIARKNYDYMKSNPYEFSIAERVLAGHTLEARFLFFNGLTEQQVSDEIIELLAPSHPSTFIQLKIRFAKWIMRL